jgi:hypothetical protein
LIAIKGMVCYLKCSKERKLLSPPHFSVEIITNNKRAEPGTECAVRLQIYMEHMERSS